jgi:hypothetical protein
MEGRTMTMTPEPGAEICEWIGCDPKPAVARNLGMNLCAEHFEADMNLLNERWEADARELDARNKGK